MICFGFKVQRYDLFLIFYNIYMLKSFNEWQLARNSVLNKNSFICALL